MKQVTQSMVKIGVGFVACLLLASCASAPKQAETRDPMRYAKSLVILENPWELGDETAFPRLYTTQAFTWGRHGTEWNVNMRAAGRAYAEFSLRRPCDLSRHGHDLAITFKMRPHHQAARLALVLENPADRAPAGHREESLSGYETGRNGEWGFYRIPLREFTTRTPGCPRVGNTENVKWEAVRKMRMVRLDDEDSGCNVFIRNLRIRSTLLAMR